MPEGLLPDLPTGRQGPDKLISFEQVIARAEKLSVSFGKGNPLNRLRYYTKIGLLPHAKRKSFNGNTPVGAYPESVVETLSQIDEKLKNGQNIQSILREKNNNDKNVQNATYNIKSFSGSSSPIRFTPIPIIKPAPESPKVQVSSFHKGPPFEPFVPPTPLAENLLEKAKPAHYISAMILMALVGIPLLYGASSDFRNSTKDILSVLNILNPKEANRQVANLDQSEDFGQVLGSLSDPYLTINVETDINAPLNAKGGVKTFGADVNADTGRVFGSNLLYGINGGENITVSGDPQNPIIDVPDIGIGDITGVTAGTGLTGGGASGSISLGLSENTISIIAGSGLSGGGSVALGDSASIGISNTYPGQTSITTVGTIGTGTWQGSTITPAYGGTGQTSYAVGDILYASGATTLSKLPIGVDGRVLTASGGLPVWSASGAGAPADRTYVTINDESGALPNSLQILAGTNISITPATATINTIANPSFGTSVTTPILTSAGSLTVTSSGGADITLNSSNNIVLTDFTGGGSGCSTLETNGSGVLACGTDDGSMTVRETDTGPSVANVTTMEFGPVSASEEEFVVTTPGAGIARIVIGSQVAKLNEAETVTGGWTFNTNPTLFTTVLNANGGINTTAGGLSLGAFNNTITVNNDLVVTNSVSSPTYTGSGAVTLSSGGAGALTLNSASGSTTIHSSDTLVVDGGNISSTDTAIIIDSGTANSITLGGSDQLTNGSWTISGTGVITAATDETVNGIDVSAGTVTDVVNLTINAGGDLTIGSIGLNDTAAPTTSGGYLIGLFDEFTNSNGTDVQTVIDDLDAAIGSGASKWTSVGGVPDFTYLSETDDDLVIGGSTIATASLHFDEAAGELNLGTDSSLRGLLRLFASGAATDPTLASDASGNLITTIGGGLSFNISDGSNTIFTVTDGGTTGNITNVGAITAGGTITFSGLASNGPVYTTAGGVLNSEAQLANSRGGTGQNSSAWSGIVKTVAGVWSAVTGTTNYAAYWSDANTVAAEQFLNVSRGGTGLSASSATNGQLLIGNGTGFTLAAITEGNGLTVTNGAGSITLAIDLLTSADGTGSSSSNSGLEFGGAGGDELALLQNCADGEILKWTDPNWGCASDEGAGAGSSKWTENGGTNILRPNTASRDIVFGDDDTDLVAPFSFDVDINTQRIGDGANDANNPTITFYASDATNSGSLSYLDADEFNFGGGNVRIPQTLILTTGAGAGVNGGGLVDCDGATQKLAWDSGTDEFSCGTDAGSGAGGSKWTTGAVTTYLTDTASDLTVGAGDTITAPFSIDVSANRVRIGDGANDANTPGIDFYASDASNSGSLIYNDSDQFQFTLGDVLVDQDLTLTGGDLNGPSGENIDLGEGAADTISFFIQTAAELLLNATALLPSTDSGLDLGSGSSQFADLYLDGGNINIDGATDVDIDNALANALTVSEGSNNFLDIDTDTDALTFGNATTNPTYSFLGSGQTTFSGNVDANSGLDVLGANFTVGGANFSVVPGSGNTLIGGTLGVTGLITASGGLTLPANQNLTMANGTGTFTQTHQHTSGAAASFNVTNTAGAGSNTSNALSIQLTGTNNGGGSNLIRGINFPDITPATNNNFTAFRLGDNFDNILIFEDDPNTGTLNFAPLTDNRVYTLPDSTGTICLSSNNCTFVSSFTVAAESGINQTITTGDTFSVLAGTGIDTVASATDNVTISVQDDSLDYTKLADTMALDTDLTINQSGSAIIQNSSTTGVAHTISLSNTGTALNLTSSSTSKLLNIDATGGVTTGIALQIQNSVAGSITTAIDVSDAEIVTALASGENNLSGTYWSLTGSNGNFDTQGVLQAGSANETLTLATGKIDADAIGLTSGSGLAAGSDTLSLLRTCNDGELLKWTSPAWACATDGGGGAASSKWTADAGGFTYLTDTNDDLVVGSNIEPAGGASDPEFWFDVNGGGRFRVTSSADTENAIEITNLTGNSFTSANALDVTATWAPVSGTNSAVDLNLTHNPSGASTLRGIDLSFVDTNALANTIYGLYVDTATANSNDNQYAAAFLNGNVGIGTSTPSVNLDVLGRSLFTYNPGADSGVTNNFVRIAGTTPVDTTNTNIHNFLFIDPTIGNASGGTNTVNGVSIDNITGDAQVTENALRIGTGWDNDIFFATDSTHTIRVQDQDTALTAGSALQVIGSSGLGGSGAGVTGGAGGAIGITTGSGGNVSGGTLINPSFGGAGGAINLTTGNGGSVTWEDEYGGNGGAMNFTTGNGGNYDVTQGGNGGNVNFILGNGGVDMGNGGTNGNGGSFSVTTGTGDVGGSINLTTAAGGQINLSSTVGAGGILTNLTPTFNGSSGTAYAMRIDPTNSATGTAGFVGLDIDTIGAGGSGTKTAINIGSNWNTGINFGGILTDITTSAGISLDITSGTTGAINIGVDATNAKTFTFGHTTPAHQFVFDTGYTSPNNAFAINANSVSTGVALGISATGITSGQALKITGPSIGSIFDDLTKITGKLGGDYDGSSLLSLQPNFSSANSSYINHGLEFGIADATSGTGGFNIVNIGAFTAGSGTGNKRAINIGTLSSGATGTSEIAISVGTGWDSILTGSLANLTSDSATGVNITNGSTTTSGTATSLSATIGSAGVGTTQNGLLITPPASTGVGTTNGVNIGTITTSNGTDTGINIGSGWDDAIKITGSTGAYTRNAIDISGYSFSPNGNNEESSLVELNFTAANSGNNADDDFVNGININTTLNQSGTGNHYGNAIKINPTMSGCGVLNYCSWTGLTSNLPAYTQNNASTIDFTGVYVAGDTLNQDLGAFGMNWYGARITMPPLINNSAFPINSYGIQLLGTQSHTGSNINDAVIYIDQRSTNSGLYIGGTSVNNYAIHLANTDGYGIYQTNTVNVLNRLAGRTAIGTNADPSTSVCDVDGSPGSDECELQVTGDLYVSGTFFSSGGTGEDLPPCGAGTPLVNSSFSKGLFIGGSCGAAVAGDPVQLAPDTADPNATANPSIWIDNTSTGHFFRFDNNATPTLVAANDGRMGIGGNIAANTGINLVYNSTWTNGFVTTLPSSTTGTVNGVSVTTGSLTSGTQNAYLATLTSAANGTINGVNITPPATTGGTTNGINIGAITTSTGVDTAINIGSNWDDGLKITGTGSQSAQNAIDISGYTYTTTAGNISNLLSLSLTASQGTTGSNAINGINIASTVNNTSSLNVANTNAINIDPPTITTCSGAVCRWNGLKVGTSDFTLGADDSDDIEFSEINVGPGNDLTNESPASLTVNKSSGFLSWYGTKITMPSLTETSGNIFAYGIKIVDSSDAGVGSTFHGIDIGSATGASTDKIAMNVSSGWNTIFDGIIGSISSGTVKGINISPSGTFTGGTTTAIDLGTIDDAGTASTALNIGAGWDKAINVADGNLVDLSAILHNDTGVQGLKLPQRGTSFSNPSSGEGYIAYRTDLDNLQIYTSGSGWVSLLDSTDSPFTSSGGIIDKSVINDVLRLQYGEAGDTQFTIENTTNNIIPTADSAVINLTGNTTGIVTNNVDALFIGGEFGNGTANTNSLLHLDMDPVNSPSGDENFYAINIDGISDSSANESAINIGSGWNWALNIDTGNSVFGHTRNGIKVDMKNSAIAAGEIGLYILDTDAGILDNSSHDLIKLDVVGDAGSSQVVNALNISTLSSNNVGEETAIQIGSGWDYVIKAAGGGSTHGLTARNISTNFGTLVESGAFVDHNSYFNEEFNTPKAANVTSDTAQAYGYMGVDVNTSCTASIVAGTANGLVQLAPANTHGCSMYNSTTTPGNGHTIFDADNLPVVLMKFKPGASFNDIQMAGLSDQVTATSTLPGNRIMFTNLNSGGSRTNNWYGTTYDGAGSAQYTSSCGTISTSNVSLLKIEVISTSSVKFYVDTNVADGVSFTYCGELTTEIPTGALNAYFNLFNAVGTATTTQIDYFRVWQDDAPISLDSSGGVVDEGSDNNPPVGSTEDIPISEAETNLADQITELGKFVAIDVKTLTAGVIHTDQLFIGSTKVAINPDGKLQIDGDLKVNGLLLADTVRTRSVEIDIPTPDPDTGKTAKTLGDATLSAGQSEILIETSAVKEDSKIFVTPTTSTDKVLSALDIIPGESFKVTVPSTSASDIKFNWWLVQVAGESN